MEEGLNIIAIVEIWWNEKKMVFLNPWLQTIQEGQTKLKSGGVVLYLKDAIESSKIKILMGKALHYQNVNINRAILLDSGSRNGN